MKLIIEEPFEIKVNENVIKMAHEQLEEIEKLHQSIRDIKAEN